MNKFANVLIFLSAVGERELPLRKVHFFRLLRGHHRMALLSRRWRGLDGYLRTVRLGRSQQLCPAVVGGMERDVGSPDRSPEVVGGEGALARDINVGHIPLPFSGDLN